MTPRQRKNLLNKLRNYPKLNIHEHLDCSLRHRTILRLWDKLEFNSNSDTTFPTDIVEEWREAQRLKQSTNKIDVKKGSELEDQAVRKFEQFTKSFASQSLAQYVEAINTFILPVIQDKATLELITRERIEDAVADGTIAMELRYAPQLSIRNGLTLREVMDCITGVLAESPIPVNLIVCALRHENGEMAEELADLAIEYKKFGVTGFDLAADEKAYPGIPEWWLKAAVRTQQAGLKATIHLGETNSVSQEEVDILDKNNITRVGHGIRIVEPIDQVFEVCLTSNVITGQVKSLAEHPVNRLYQDGRRVCINTDGLTFTLSSLTNEYAHLVEHFNWGAEDFYAVNLTALEASNFSPKIKVALRTKLRAAYAARS